jgi:TPP-dependent indolepyruvate ferredoxin oxidoreductase alpha subunit
MGYHRLPVIRRDSMPHHPARESSQTEEVNGIRYPGLCVQCARRPSFFLMEMIVVIWYQVHAIPWAAKTF